MYTGFLINVKLKNLPVNIYRTLFCMKDMIMLHDIECVFKQFNKHHSFFDCTSAGLILTGKSGSFDKWASTIFIDRYQNGNIAIYSASSTKGVCKDLGLFFDWIYKYIDAKNGDVIGFAIPEGEYYGNIHPGIGHIYSDCGIKTCVGNIKLQSPVLECVGDVNPDGWKFSKLDDEEN